MSNLLKALILSTSLIACTSSFAMAWEIDADGSRVAYASIKKDHVAETHTISGVSGTVTDTGEVSVSLDLNTVDSGIDVRNARMSDMLFNVSEFPNAVFNASVDLDEFSSLAIGETAESFVSGILSLAGNDIDIDFDVLVIRASDDKVIVTPVAPILLDAELLGLKGGVDGLKDIAKLPIISYAVPLTFTLVFTN